MAGVLVPAVALAAAHATSAAAAGDRELGQYLSAECTTCHQLSGNVTAGVPAIVGFPEDQFIALMNSYKLKERDNPVMQTITGRLTAEDIAALAAYFGSLPQPSGAK